FLDYKDSTQCVQVNSFWFSRNPIPIRSPATISSEISPLRCSRTSVGRLLALSILILQLVFSPCLFLPQAINDFSFFVLITVLPCPSQYCHVVAFVFSPFTCNVVT